MQCSVETSDNNVTIHLKERLIYSDTTAFSPLLDQLRGLGKPGCTVDLQQLVHIDSSGLRMLLLLHDVCRDLGANLCFKTAPGQVHTMLMHSRFDTIVTIEA